MSLTIAEKILRQQLDDTEQQKRYVNALIEDLNHA